MKISVKRLTSAAAFSLVEVALALGVAGFCLSAVVGLVPLGVDSGQAASDQAISGSILTHVLADLRSTSPVPSGTIAKSPQYALTIPDNTARTTSTDPVFVYFGNSAEQFSIPIPGSASPPSAGASRYRLTVQYLPTAGGRTATGVSLLVSWPAQVDPTKPATGRPTGRVQIFAALDRN